MTRRMSVSMTLPAVRARTKTVTRRHPDTWQSLEVGEHLLLIEKGMGLPKGAKQVVVAEVVVTSNELRPLWPIGWGEILAEGLWDEARAAVACGSGGYVPSLEARWFCEFWLDGHGYKRTDDPALVTCRRISWRYLDA